MAKKKGAVKAKIKAAIKSPAAKKIAMIGAAVSTGGVSLLASKKVQKKIVSAAKKAPLKKIAKIGAAISTGGVSLLADKNNRQKIGAAAKKIATGAKAVAKKVGAVGKKAASIALFLPFAPVAAIFLKRRGVTPSRKPDELIVQVHNEMTKKSFGLVEGGDSFDFGESDDMDFGYADEVESYGIIPVTPGMIIAVVKFLKGIFDAIKAKKAKGEALSPAEETVMEQAPELEKSIEEAQGTAEEVMKETAKTVAKIEDKGAGDAEKLLSTAGSSDEEKGTKAAEKILTGKDEGGKVGGISDVDGGGSNKKMIFIVVAVVVLLLFFFIKK